MKLSKKINIWKIIWVAGIFAILLIILYLVVEYKVKYEDFYIIIKSLLARPLPKFTKIAINYFVKEEQI